MTIESTRPRSDFAELRDRIDEAGLLERRPTYYLMRVGAILLAFTVGWTAFLTLGSSWWQLVTAVFIAVVFAQLALVAHDLAHLQIFRTRRPSEVVGRILGNLGIGMGYGWWMDKHTRHHANPNHEELDPDVAPDLLTWSSDQALGASGLARFVSKYEAWLFFPLLTLEGFNLHVSSVRSLFRRNLKCRRLEAGLLITHFVAYVSVVFTVLSPGKAIVWILLNQALFGVYLGCCFAPNHKGMPTLKSGERLDFLRKQVLTSRNVRGNVVTDHALGGLNYQIEHHLFPNMPMPNLHKAQPIVRDYCAQRGVAYAETGLLESYAIALRHLHAVGAPLRNR